ncbi:EexN family lipoprotein [Pantoea sp. PGP6]
MKTGLLSLSLLAAVLLTGCDAGAKSLEWYKAHDKERSAKVEECRKASDPRGTEDCRNAIDASVRADGNITSSKPQSWSFGDKQDSTKDGNTH